MPTGKPGAVSEILERGEVFFFHRPRVGVEEVHGLDDVGRFFIPANPPELLDHPGVEFVLIGASHAAQRELGIDLEAGREPLP